MGLRLKKYRVPLTLEDSYFEKSSMLKKNELSHLDKETFVPLFSKANKTPKPYPVTNRFSSFCTPSMFYRIFLFLTMATFVELLSRIQLASATTDDSTCTDCTALDATVGYPVTIYINQVLSVKVIQLLQQNCNVKFTTATKLAYLASSAFKSLCGSCSAITLSLGAVDNLFGWKPDPSIVECLEQNLTPLCENEILCILKMVLYVIGGIILFACICIIPEALVIGCKSSSNSNPSSSNRSQYDEIQDPEQGSVSNVSPTNDSNEIVNNL